MLSERALICTRRQMHLVNDRRSGRLYSTWLQPFQELPSASRWKSLSGHHSNAHACTQIRYQLPRPLLENEPSSCAMDQLCCPWPLRRLAGQVARALKRCDLSSLSLCYGGNCSFLLCALHLIGNASSTLFWPSRFQMPHYSALDDTLNLFRNLGG